MSVLQLLQLPRHSQAQASFASVSAAGTPFTQHRPRRSRPGEFASPSSEFDKDYSRFLDDDEEDAGARSEFGTKSYWDAMYDGMGDFSADVYSWYYGFEVIKPMLQEYGPDASGTDTSELNVLVPGCGNDPLLLNLYDAGYRRVTAFDYSSGALERQRDLLGSLAGDLGGFDLRVEDARSLPEEWEESFDVIIEKGALDAVYLSGKGHFEQSTREFARILRKDGICISVSGVVPEALRRKWFGDAEWDWLRDGSNDLKAGCFVFKRR